MIDYQVKEWWAPYAPRKRLIWQSTPSPCSLIVSPNYVAHSPNFPARQVSGDPGPKVCAAVGGQKSFDVDIEISETGLCNDVYIEEILWLGQNLEGELITKGLI